MNIKSKVSLLFSISLFIATIGFSQQTDNYLIKIHEGKYDERGVNTAYINSNGDTIIPYNKYFYCFTDTLKYFAIVIDYNTKCIAIDKNENVLFEVFWCDNGPDYFSEGLFRIKEKGKIGYANEKGEIVILPQFECAFPFDNGIAKVSFECSTQQDFEHSKWISNNWFFIDKNGKRIK